MGRHELDSVVSLFIVAFAIFKQSLYYLLSSGVFVKFTTRFFLIKNKFMKFSNEGNKDTELSWERFGKLMEFRFLKTPQTIQLKIRKIPGAKCNGKEIYG